MVRVTSVPDGVLAGAVRVTVPLAAPSPVTMETLAGKEEVKPRSFVARTVKAPPVPLAIATVKGTEMVEPGSRVLSAWAWGGKNFTF